MGLLIETDLGRDADDLFALLWLYQQPNVDIQGICITPGDPDQIAVAECLNKIFYKDIMIYVPSLDRNKSSSNPFHKKFITRHGGNLLEKADLPSSELNKIFCPFSTGKYISDLIVLGPCSNIGTFLTNYSGQIQQATMQGGFYPSNEGKFTGLTSCPTFNLNGDKPNGLIFLNTSAIYHRQMVGKNVGHYKCIWTKDRLFKNDLLRDTFKLFTEFSDSKKLQDPMATVCHFHPEIGKWTKGKTIRVRGGWTTDLTNQTDDILIDIDEERFWEIYN